VDREKKDGSRLAYLGSAGVVSVHLSGWKLHQLPTVRAKRCANRAYFSGLTQPRIVGIDYRERKPDGTGFHAITRGRCGNGALADLKNLELPRMSWCRDTQRSRTGIRCAVSNNGGKRRLRGEIILISGIETAPSRRLRLTIFTRSTPTRFCRWTVFRRACR